MQIPGRTLICGNFNAHDQWWNSTVTNSVRSEALVGWLIRKGCEFINTPDVLTYHRDDLVNISVLDLLFATQPMIEKVLNWEIPESLLNKSDHMLIRFNVITERAELVEITLLIGPYNLEKADWKKFYDILRAEAISLIGMK
jgi:hypothetical protein